MYKNNTNSSANLLFIQQIEDFVEKVGGSYSDLTKDGPSRSAYAQINYGFSPIILIESQAELLVFSVHLPLFSKEKDFHPHDT
jgi:hypothetical protein